MVQFPQFRFRTLCIQMRMTVSRPPGYPIRLSTDHGMCAPPRRLSQLATAFFASIRQGIHRKPFYRLTILSFRGIKSLHDFIPSGLPLKSNQFFLPSGETQIINPMSPVKDLHEIRGSNPLMEIRGFEPLTSSLQSWRSSQLSYIPE